MKTVLSFIIVIAAVGVWYFIKKRPDSRFRNISAIVALAGLVLFAIFFTNDTEYSTTADLSSNQGMIGSFSNLSESSLSSQKQVESSTIPSQVDTLEAAVGNSSDFTEYEYNQEYDAYIISTSLNNTFGDKKAIEFFNDSIFNFLKKDIKTDKPVIFRAWYNEQGTTMTGALVYFTPENFNRNWSELSFDSTKIYQISSGWSTVSKFGQYLSLASKAENSDIEGTLFYLLGLTKE